MVKTFKDYIPILVKKFNEDSPIPGYKITEKEVGTILKYFFYNMETVLQEPNTSIGLHKYFKIHPDLKELDAYYKKMNKRFRGY